MENSIDNSAIAETHEAEVIQEPQTEAVAPQDEAPDQQGESFDESTMEADAAPAIDNVRSEIDRLVDIRTGQWSVALGIDDLKWLKNQCNSTFSFKGPNDAFMLVNAFLGLDSAIQMFGKDKEAQSCQLAASTVEAVAILINRYEGKGVPAAQRTFKIAVSLQQVVTQMRELDQAIDALEKANAAQNSEQDMQAAPTQEN